MGRRTIDIKTREQIIDLVSQGKSYREVARIVGCTKDTAKRYCDKYYDRISHNKKAYAKKYSDMSMRLLDAVDAEDVRKASLSQKILGAGLMLDKSRLLLDQSTANVNDTRIVLVRSPQGVKRAAKSKNFNRIFDPNGSIKIKSNNNSVGSGVGSAKINGSAGGRGNKRGCI